jgi:ubiquinone/menaquinone biosynthesis C-methylase UbiE
LKYLNQKSLPAQARILDAGCGQGKALLQLSRQNLEIIGVDNCENNCKIAGQNVNQFAKNKQINLVNASLTNLPFPNDYFDAIISLDVIEFIGDDASAFKELARVLKPSGKLIVSVLHKNLETEDDNFSFEQRLFRKLLPRWLLAKHQLYNGKNWLKASAADRFKRDGRFRNYTLEDIQQKVGNGLKLVRSQYMIKGFFRLAMDITYSIKGGDWLKPLVFPIALALDAIFCRRKPGYAIIMEFKKIT